MRWALLLVMSALLGAQPSIDLVTGPAGSMTPGGFAIVEGSFFDRTARVDVGGYRAAVIDFLTFYCALPGCEVDLIIQLPPELKPGTPINVVVTMDGISAPPYPITI